MSFSPSVNFQNLSVADMSKILTITSNTILLVCIGFLIFQTTKCVLKFVNKPKGTNVGITEASKMGYPAITICPLLIYEDNPDYIEVLKECNLSVKEYFDEAKWIGTGPTYCKNPAELYEKVAGSPDTLIENIEIESNDNIIEIDATKDKFEYLDHPKDLGRCFSMQIPKKTQISAVFIKGNDEIGQVNHYHFGSKIVR